jgi:uncharacterized membrane protein
MNVVIASVSAFGLGAAAAYLFDPNRGRRRRAMTADRVTSAVHAVNDAFEVTSRDVRNRLAGTGASLRTRLRHDRPSDEVLSERVRAQLGGLVRHPRALEVDAHEGRVTLRGPVLAHETETLIRRVRRMRGVREVDGRLDVRHENGGVPALQGEPPRSGPRSTFMQTTSPAARLAAGAAGALVAAYGVKAPRPIRPVAWLTGLGLVARATTNLELRRLLGVGAGRRTVNVQKTITVAAPLADTFGLWSRYEHFPKFMEHVIDVQRRDDGRSHWTVRGPVGVPLYWEAVETVREQNRRLGWTTVEGSWIAHAGTVRFDAQPEGGTRVDIKFSYTPLVGAIGHAGAAVLGQDPKRMLDEDLVRLKSLLEDGRTRAHGRHVRRDALERPRRDDVGRTGIWPSIRVPSERRCADRQSR